MAKMHPYLNFDGTAEEAFNFYKTVLGGEFVAIHRMSGMPGGDQVPENEKNRIMHISLAIDEHTVLMASDIMPSYGHKLIEGNNQHLSLHPASREETERLFNGLSAGGTVEMALEDMFWGAYYGSFKDKYGIQWMVNYDTTPA